MEIDISGDDSAVLNVCRLTRPNVGPSPFEVSLFSYKTQPWMNKNVDLTQWFNYGLNPMTWTKYSIQQIELFNYSKN